MQGLIITHQGIEDIAALEVKELIKKKAVVSETIVQFPLKNTSELNKLCQARSVKRVVLLLGTFPVTSLESVEKQITKIINKQSFTKTPLLFSKKKSCAVECERMGSHDFSSVDVQSALIPVLKEKLKIPFDYKKPEVLFYVYIYKNNGFVGIDAAGVDLSKRSYKVFHQGDSIKGTLAYALGRIAGIKKKDKILDPLCHTGIVAIEAALYQAGLPVHVDEDLILVFPEKKKKQSIALSLKKIASVTATHPRFHFIDITKKNAAAAGIILTTQKAELDWLETGYGEKAFYHLLLKVPIPSNRVSNQAIFKVYDDLFYEAGLVLKSKGTLGIITEKPEPLLERAKKYKLALLHQRVVYSGQQEYTILIWRN